MSAEVLAHAQHLVSDDPEVVAVIGRNAEAKERLWEAQVQPWAKERGAERVVLSVAGDRVQGLPRQPEGFGRWTQPKHGVSTPYRTNETERALLAELRVKFEAVPGVPREVDSVRDSNGSFYWMTPRPFVHDGRAWVGLDHAPDPERNERQHFGPQWRECLASEFHTAHAAHRMGVVRRA